MPRGRAKGCWCCTRTHVCMYVCSHGVTCMPACTACLGRLGFRTPHVARGPLLSNVTRCRCSEPPRPLPRPCVSADKPRWHGTRKALEGHPKLQPGRPEPSLRQQQKHLNGPWESPRTHNRPGALETGHSQSPRAEQSRPRKALLPPSSQGSAPPSMGRPAPANTSVNPNQQQRANQLTSSAAQPGGAASPAQRGALSVHDKVCCGAGGPLRGCPSAVTHTRQSTCFMNIAHRTAKQKSR